MERRSQRLAARSATSDSEARGASSGAGEASSGALGSHQTLLPTPARRDPASDASSALGGGRGDVLGADSGGESGEGGGEGQVTPAARRVMFAGATPPHADALQGLRTPPSNLFLYTPADVRTPAGREDEGSGEESESSSRMSGKRARARRAAGAGAPKTARAVRGRRGRPCPGGWFVPSLFGSGS